MVSTKLIGKLFVSRQKEIDRYAKETEAIQEHVFRKLIQTAAATEWGKKYNYANIRTYTDFQRVPIQQYDDVKGYVDRMRHGEKNILWPGQVVWQQTTTAASPAAQPRQDRDAEAFSPAFPKKLRHSCVLSVLLQQQLFCSASADAKKIRIKTVFRTTRPLQSHPSGTKP